MTEIGGSLRALRWPLLLLLVTPVAPIIAYAIGDMPILVFATGSIAVAVLADWIRRATEHLSASVGQAVGGLLSISFGSLAEIILASFVLLSGKADVVRAQITGSIIGTSLLGLGLAVVIGSLGGAELRFNRERAGMLSSMLILLVLALLLPAVFDWTARSVTHRPQVDLLDEHLSIGISAVLLLLYAANLVYTLVSHRDVFAPAETEQESGGAWSLGASVGVLLAASAVVAIEAELVSGALEQTAGQLGLSEIFLGIVVLALVGTASDLVAAPFFARRGKMALVLNLCLGSSIQIALVVAPLLVFISWIIGHPMTLVFNSPLDLFAIAGTAFIVNAIASDGETTWFEGVLLIGVYALLALAFFYVG